MAQDPRLRASCSSLRTRPHQTLNSVLILGCSFTGHWSSVWPREVLWRGGRGPLKKGFDRRRGGEFCSPSSGPQSPDHNVQSIVAYLGICRRPHTCTPGEGIGLSPGRQVGSRHRRLARGAASQQRFQNRWSTELTSLEAESPAPVLCSFPHHRAP